VFLTLNFGCVNLSTPQHQRIPKRRHLDPGCLPQETPASLHCNAHRNSPTLEGMRKLNSYSASPVVFHPATARLMVFSCCCLGRTLVFAWLSEVLSSPLHSAFSTLESTLSSHSVQSRFLTCELRPATAWVAPDIWGADLLRVIPDEHPHIISRTSASMAVACSLRMTNY
jgi:hypothetical protein